MRFSVVIPLYHSSQTLGRAINSVMAQTFSPHEIILIADDGADYQPFVTDTRIRLFSTQTVGAGAGFARNIGIDSATGDAIALLDADDAFHPQRLEMLAPLVERYGAAFSGTRYIDDANGMELPNINYVFEKECLNPTELLLSGMHTLVHLVFDPKRCPLRNDVSPAAQDTILAAKLYDYTEQVGYSPLPLYDYYRSAGSFCRQTGAAQKFLDFIDDVLEPNSDAYAKISQYNAFAALSRYLKVMREAEQMVIENSELSFQATLRMLVEQHHALWIER
jgi:glycosyltransferase involved in cell wall biosynthesis